MYWGSHRFIYHPLTHLSMNGMCHTCLYSTATECHRLSQYSFPESLRIGGSVGLGDLVNIYVCSLIPVLTFITCSNFFGTPNDITATPRHSKMVVPVETELPDIA